jgi:hypothetical protein
MACILGRYLVEQEELALSQYQTLMSYFPAVVQEEDGFLSKGANRVRYNLIITIFGNLLTFHFTVHHVRFLDPRKIFAINARCRGEFSTSMSIHEKYSLIRQ